MVVRFVSLLPAVALLFCARLAFARPVPSEPSAYGKFDVIPSRTTCAVSFTPTGKKPRVLFTVEGCLAGGVAPLKAVESAPGTALPLTADSGEELHVFSVATARDGNATDGDDFWVVVVKRKGVWSARAPLQSTGFQSVKASSTKRAIFTLEQEATSVSEGLRWSVSFGGVKKTRIPRVPSTIVSQAKRTYVGELDGGGHTTGFRPSLQVGQHVLVIHEDGKCKLPRPGKDAGMVELDAELTRYSDDREVVRCLAVRAPVRAPAPRER